MLGVILIVLLGFVILILQSRKATVTVEEIEKSPVEYLDRYDANLDVLPIEKRVRVYRYVFSSDRGELLDSKKYLFVHPNDAVLKKIREEGMGPVSRLLVFSNQLPDPKFLLVSE